MSELKTIGDIPREGNSHLQITISDYQLYSCTLTRVRSGLWVVTENGVCLLKTEIESDAVTRFLALLADKKKADTE